MSRSGFEYAQLPQFKYQTFDRETLSFSDVPLDSLFGGPPRDDDEANADAQSNKDAPLEDGTANPPEDSSPPAPGMYTQYLFSD